MHNDLSINLLISYVHKWLNSHGVSETKTNTTENKESLEVWTDTQKGIRIIKIKRKKNSMGISIRNLRNYETTPSIFCGSFQFTFSYLDKLSIKHERKQLKIWKMLLSWAYFLRRSWRMCFSKKRWNFWYHRIQHRKDGYPQDDGEGKFQNNSHAAGLKRKQLIGSIGLQEERQWKNW